MLWVDGEEACGEGVRKTEIRVSSYLGVRAAACSRVVWTYFITVCPLHELLLPMLACAQTGLSHGAARLMNGIWAQSAIACWICLYVNRYLPCISLILLLCHRSAAAACT